MMAWPPGCEQPSQAPGYPKSGRATSRRPMMSRQKTRVDSRSDVLMATWNRPCNTADGSAQFVLIADLAGLLAASVRRSDHPMDDACDSCDRFHAGATTYMA